MLATTFILAALALPSVTIASPLLETRAASSRYASPLTTWDLQGCAMDKYPNSRVLSGAGYYSNNGVSITNCLNYCDSQGAVFAGVENANQCFCSNVGLENGGAYGPTGANLKQTSNDGCNLSCRGNGNQACGGSNYIQVYKSNKRVTPTVPQVSGATYLGCFPDNVNKRLLPTLEAQGDMANTNEKCVATCRAAGLDLAGTEYANECWCGSSSKVSLPAKTTGCTQSCSGAQGEICGGGSRLTVYKLSGVSNGGGSGGSGSGGSGSGGSGTTPPSGSTPPASNPASYTYNGATYQYQGCYTDRSDGAGRALTDYYSSSNARTVEGCLRSCQNAGNFLYAGLEYGSECRCGNSLASFSTPTGTCNKPCSSGNGEICGGNYALTLYAQPQQQASTTPASTGSSGSSTTPAGAAGGSSSTNGGAAGGSSSTSPAAAGGASSGSTTTGGASGGSSSTNGGAAGGSSTSTTSTGGAAGGSSSTTTGSGSAAAVN